MTETGPRVGVVGTPASWSSEVLADAMALRTGHRLLIDVARLELDTEGRVRSDGIDLCALDGLVIKKIGQAYSAQLLDRIELLRSVEASGVPCFSSPTRILRLFNRLSCTSTLLQGGIRLPPTVVTESPERAARAVREFGEAVLKPLYTTKARGMIVLRAEDADLEHRLSAFKAAGNPTLYVQQMVEHAGRDLAVVFLGEEHLGTYARVGAPGSWNTAGGHYEPHQPSTEVLSLGRKAAGLFGLDFTSVDVAETADGPIVFEVSAFGGYRGLKEALGIHAPDHYADYVLERVMVRSPLSGTPI